MEVEHGTVITDGMTLSSPIKVDCSTDYTNQTSLLFIHPFQFPVISITVHFKHCDSPQCFCSRYDMWGCLQTICQSPGSRGPCPTSYMSTDNYTCASNREGLLCGKCSEGHAVAINDPDLNCVECKSPYYGIAIFLFLQLVPVLIFLTLLAILHIKITDGGLSGLVLFSQMVTLQFPGQGYSSLVPTCMIPNSQYIFGIPLTVYSIWNLNFLYLDPVPFCIPIDTAAVIAFQYITAACPLVFIVVTYIWIKWYNNGYRLVVYTTRPVHRLLARFWQIFKIQPSLIDTYAGLLPLSYMCFLITSVKLLKYTIVRDYSTNNFKNISFY